MINIITNLSADQVCEATNKLHSLNNMDICEHCSALIQFDKPDINRNHYIPTIECSCGNDVKVHYKYRTII